MRYIDADKLKAHYEYWGYSKYDMQEEKKLFDDIVDQQPTADVVEVVRCNDCKHRKEEHFNIVRDGYSCELSGLMVKLEHYCSYGERADK